MSDENAQPSRRLLAVRRITLGEIAMASFALCALSGVLLVPAFDARDASGSIADWLLTNPGAVWLRNVHYWTAQVFLVATVLHIWDHVRLSTERRVGRGVWLRLTLSIPVIGFLMLSGFMLRGDSDAQQANRILREIIGLLPLIGSGVNRFLFGAGEQLQVVYLHHAATATIIVWLVIIEHVRRLWPRATATVVTVSVVGAVGLVLSAGLHDGMDARMKGPWYFLGLQEVLHWTPWPWILLGLALICLFGVWVLPRLSGARAKSLKAIGTFALGGYVVLCGVGLFLRGENWSWKVNLPDGSSDLRAGLIVPSSLPFDATTLTGKLPTVLGRTEGCLVCHGEVTGLGAAHQPQSIGCASCHGGDVFTLEPKRAHAGMILVPGNLADASQTCGQAGCHSDIIPRVERSIMTTFAGAIEVDRTVFGETTKRGSAPPHVRELGTSAADTHLRQLCASCHVGQTRENWGPISQESRGGGCNACHLSYSDEASKQLAVYESAPPSKRTKIPSVHPALRINAGSENCFGCHSRSGRISTNHEGWHELRAAPAETALVDDAMALKPRFRQLEDGRFFTRIVPDVHQERGLDCIDCHTPNEIMGQGQLVHRKHEQLTVRCEDCHTREFSISSAGTHDAETQKLWQIRQWSLAPEERIAATSSGDPLSNVIIATDGTGRMRRKRSGEAVELRPPLAVCTSAAGHSRLSCSSCHTAWAPRCASCHTSFDQNAEAFDHVLQDFVAGGWQEKSGAFEAVPPTLGIRMDPHDSRHPTGVVDTFVPGMILELDRNRDALKPPDLLFRRLYARTFAHTIRREARSCESCHSDPVALGYGRGVLRFVATGETGRWQFAPEHERLPADDLPADAWIGFLQSRDDRVSTRDDVRPFTVDEQWRVLRVGACLTCHSGDTAVMQGALADFESALARRSGRCVLPLR